MGKVVIALLLFMLCVLTPSQACSEVTVTLTLDTKEARPSDSIKMVVSVSGTRSCDSPPEVEGLDSFNVSQIGRSSKVEIINGTLNVGIEYTYYIGSTKTGTFQIGPALVKVKGKTFESNTDGLTIVSVGATEGRDQGPVFLTSSLSSKKTFVEGQVIYTLKLYLRARVSDISLGLPQTDHLTFKQLNKPKEYESVNNGRRYRVIEVRYALIPLREGNYGIEPSRMDLTVYESGKGSRRGLFDSPFFGRGRSLTVSSKPLELEVLPLPLKGKPDDFSGLVGVFKIESTLAPTKIGVGESATLTVRLSGRGNVNRIPDLKPPVLDHLKIYADEPVLDVKTDSRGQSGQKSMKWALVPEKEGYYEIPSMSVDYFDMEKRRYLTIQTIPLSLRVIPGKEERVMIEKAEDRLEAAKRPAKQEVKEIGHDILPLHGSVRDIEAGRSDRPRGLLLWALLLIPFLVYCAAYLGLRIKKRSTRLLPAQRAKKAAKQLKQRCRQGGENADSLALAIRDYLNDRFGLSLASVTPEDAVDILTSEGVRPQTAQALQGIMKRLEDGIYTGNVRGTDRMKEDIPRLVKQIEKEIP